MKQKESIISIITGKKKAGFFIIRLLYSYIN